MARQVQVNEAAAARRRVYFHIVDATDGITAELGEAGGQPEVSTNGGAWVGAAAVSVLVAIGFGRYYADLTAASVNTVGDLNETRYKSAATAESVGDSIEIVAHDPARDIGKILGGVAGKVFINAAGTQIQWYAFDGALFATIDWNPATTTWDVTWV